VSNSPVRRDDSAVNPWEEAPLPIPSGESRLPDVGELWAMLLRRKWLILLAVLVTTTATAYFTFRQTPVYQATVLLRIQDKQVNLPEIFRDLGRRSNITTEITVLSSRALAEDAATRVGARLGLVSPTRVQKGRIIANAKVAPGAPEGLYRLLRRPAGGYAVFDQTTGAPVPARTSRDSVAFAGVEIAFRPDSASYSEIVLAVSDLVDAANGIRSSLTVSQPSRDADIVQIDYEGTDPETVRRVANTIAARYIERRQDAFKAEARGSARFLGEQVDRVGVELAAVEDTFRRFREQSQVIDPESEASSEVSRLINTQAERSGLNAERQALLKSLDQLTREAAARKPGEPSPYRQLLAFPVLIQNEAANQLLAKLNAVESARDTLLKYRTAKDPDVVALTSRLADLEAQLRSLAVTYLTGLTNRVASMDSTLGGFTRQLEQIPRKQVQYARLQRRAKNLEDAYNLLQTRLKESEIAQSIDDPSVQVVDTAQTPVYPTRPNPRLNLMGGILVGLMLGVAGALLREHLDRSVHTRRDVMSATGLPVMGLIPHVTAKRGPRVALISDHTGADPRGEQSAHTAETSHTELTGTDSPHLDHGHSGNGRTPAAATRTSYTFLNVAPPEDPLVAPPEPRPLPRPEPVPSASRVHTSSGSAKHTPARSWRLVVSGTGTPAAEAYGSLQTNIAFARRDLDVKTLVLTSPLPGDGKSTCAVNLALTLALRGLRTLLIDADMRRGMVHTAFNASKHPGLSDVLSGGTPVQDAIRHVEVGTERAVLHFLTCGGSPTTPYSLVDSPRMRQMLKQLTEQFDRIIIDTPPVNVVTDAALLGALADGVLLIARAGVTEAAALSYALEQLRHVRAPVLGVVLNDIDFRRDGAYDRTYKYYTNDYVGTTNDS
jgi:capsular exopolysaccharide synthesis family protein